MFSRFSTGMERAHVLNSLRSSIGARLPASWLLSHPVQSRLALSMTSADPSQRPSCAEIVGDLLEEKLWVKPSFEQMEELVSMQHRQLKDLQREVEALKRERGKWTG